MHTMLSDNLAEHLTLEMRKLRSWEVKWLVQGHKLDDGQLRLKLRYVDQVFLQSYEQMIVLYDLITLLYVQ